MEEEVELELPIRTKNVLNPRPDNTTWKWKRKCSVVAESLFIVEYIT